MIWGMEDLRCAFFGMQDMNSKKLAGKVVCGIGQPPLLDPPDIAQKKISEQYQ